MLRWMELMTDRIMHHYRVSIPVTKGNRKELEREHGKILLPGDTFLLSFTGGLKPTPTMSQVYRDLADEMGGTAEYQIEETTTSDWKVL